MHQAILSHALSLGFSAAGFCAPEIGARERERLRAFVAAGEHGDMKWMEEKAHLREDPKALWPEVKSILMLAHNYGPAENPLEKLSRKEIGVISAYAQHRDYHDVMKKRLRTLAAWIAGEYGCGVKLFVDTAPVMEKPLAVAAGLGWMGKHTCIVSREFGSWLFLGEIFTTLSPPPMGGRVREGARPQTPPSPIDAPPPRPSPLHGEGVSGGCGTCTRCLDICPTQAFTGCGKLDARKCLAYLTIEHKGQIPLEFRKPMGNRIYGCDDCLAVCPWNKFAQTSQESAYHARDDLKSPRLSALVTLDDAQFRAFFSGSPVKRIGRDRFVRNVLVAIGNSGDASLLPLIAPLREDASPLVAEMAAWAMAELIPPP